MINWEQRINLELKKNKKEFDSQPVYNEKYPRNNIKSCKGKINTNFHEDSIPKKDL